MHRPSGFALSIGLLLGGFEGLREDPHIPMILNFAKAPLGFQVCECARAHDHVAIPPHLK